MGNKYSIKVFPNSPFQSTVSVAPILVATLLASLIVGKAYAQKSPPLRQIAPQTAAGAESVHAVDLDGDSDSDVIYVTSNTITLHENTESGFSDQKIITRSLRGGRSVHTSDIDGDGDPDVLSASFYDAKIAWYENTESGFSSQKVITTNAVGATSVHAADLDGDGDPDVLSASSEDDKIAWYENTESGFSDQRIIVDDEIGAKSVFAADLDGDSDLDVLSASFESDRVVWYENKIADSGFSDPKIIEDNLSGATSVHAADLDGDGDPDVLSASLIDGKITWHRNGDSSGDGDGSFWSTIDITTSASGAESVHTADVNGNGDPDILSASGDKIAWYENTESGFSNQKVITTDAGGAASVYAADLDEDSDLDILSASFDDKKIGWYSNRIGQGKGFSSEKVIAPVDPVNDVRDTHPADLDGDSDPDVVLASMLDDKIVWYENTESGFSDQRAITDSADGVESVYTADLDGDGDPDVLSASRRRSRIAWYENTESGFSSQKVVTDNANGGRSVYAADLNEDGDPDVVSASSKDDKIAWYENNGGTFSGQKVITTDAVHAQSVHAADLDGDDDLDVLSASSFDNKIAWYENTETGFSSQKVVTDNADGAMSVYAADLNEDGDPDVVSASSKDDKIAWYENTESGFSEQNIITEDAVGARSVLAADLDDDSDLDVLSASGNKIAWHEQTTTISGISFTRKLVFGSSNMGSRSINTADIDGDSDFDLLSGFSDPDNDRAAIYWHENTSQTLPVELVGFAARTDGGAVLLTWRTASETGNSGFEVQRRAQGKDSWRKVGFREGAGTTTAPQNYRFRDTGLPRAAGRLTYRLRQVDIDGTVHLSNPVTVERGDPKTFSVGPLFPNPAQSVVQSIVKLTESRKVTAALYDLLGRKVRTLTTGKMESGRHVLNMDVEGLPSGAYFLRIKAGSSTESRKVTVVR